MCPKCADGMANSVDTDQTAPIWVCTVCPDLSVRKLRIITVQVGISNAKLGIVICSMGVEAISIQG